MFSSTVVARSIVAIRFHFSRSCFGSEVDIKVGVGCPCPQDLFLSGGVFVRTNGRHAVSCTLPSTPGWTRRTGLCVTAMLQLQLHFNFGLLFQVSTRSV